MKYFFILCTVFIGTYLSAQDVGYQKVTKAASVFFTENIQEWPDAENYLDVSKDYIYANIKNGYLSISNNAFMEEFYIQQKVSSQSDNGITTEVYTANDKHNKFCIILLIKNDTKYLCVKIIYSCYNVFDFQ